MYIIFSETLDHTTNLVLNWFSKYDRNILVVNDYDSIKVKFNDIDNVTLQYKNTNIPLSSIKGIWFRRGKVKLTTNNKNIGNQDIFRFNINTKIKVENFINLLLIKDVKCIGNPFKLSVNKLESLLIAKEVGFITPKTLITEKAKEVKAFFEGSNVITKLLSPLQTMYESNHLNFLTFECDLSKMDEEFSLSFFQEKIEKLYEVRIFYIQGEMYSKAIFSQNDEQTSVDYRNYNSSKPNREVPFSPPEDLKNKVSKFMNIMNLDTGSIDIIVRKDSQFVFLEVNPIGQFSDMSYNCNYFLEKKIVEKLL